ncbi:hypothetical protein CC77DRAFT_803066 [Alternaria alternata]|uniref:Uncharacterized protein n=1 Tax=Alternaria alternata TaxID=5599 RepID=A0A177DND1_ALTAL|nr:hypothetical protein CC77DRAFT_803066 [Alternaria alternata]OAG21464.1 hypothetical protein CC77DRAFT_803066 [Alternaria alternata]
MSVGNTRGLHMLHRCTITLPYRCIAAHICRIVVVGAAGNEVEGLPKCPGSRYKGTMCVYSRVPGWTGRCRTVVTRDLEHLIGPEAERRRGLAMNCACTTVWCFASGSQTTGWRRRGRDAWRCFCVSRMGKSHPRLGKEPPARRSKFEPDEKAGQEHR